MNVSPYILLSLTSLFWSLNFIVGKLLTDTIPPATLAFFRWGLPLLFYLPYSWKDILENKETYKKHWRLILLLGLTGYMINPVSVYEAVRFTSTINTSFINAFNPVVIALTGLIMYRYPVYGKQVLGFILSLLGVIWIIFKGTPALILGLHVNIGDLFMVVSVVSWSIHTILYKRHLELFPAKSIFPVMILSGVSLLVPCILVENAIGGVEWLKELKINHFWGIIYLSIFPSVLAYRFWNHALTKITANKVAIFQYLIPIYTIIISLLFLGESLQPFQLIGGMLIFVGVLLVTK